MPKKTKIQGDPKRAIAYLRVSRDTQELSPDAQREAIRGWCAAAGVALVGTYEDLGICGADPVDDRPGLLAAIAALREHGAGILLVGKRDRLARETLEVALAERLVRDAGAVVRAADRSDRLEDDGTWLQTRIEDIFAEVELRRIRRRTREALAVKKARGEHCGGVPRGMKIDGTRLVPDLDSDGLAMARRARELRAAGATFRRIADQLELEGFLPVSGRKIHPTTVRNMTINPRLQMVAA
jgi:DNA invertase Pin-like site-specific DNA recombinase